MKGTKRFLNVMYIMFFLIISSNLSSQVQKAQESNSNAEKALDIFDTVSLLEVTSSPASEAKGHKCFLYTLDQIKEQLKDKIECYTKDLHLDENDELREVIEAAKILGRAEGRISLSEITQKETSLSKEVEHFEKIRGKFNFANTAYDVLSKTIALNENDFDKLFKGVGDEIEKISKRNNFATYFTSELKRLRLYVRRLEELNISYSIGSTNPSQKSNPKCLPVTQELSILRELHDDPTEKGFNTKYALKCRPNEDNLHIRPEDFEREGLALTFITSYDYPTVPTGKFTPVLLGMQNNVEKFFYGIMQNPNKIGEVIHKVVINSKEFVFKLTTKCSEIGLALVSFQDNPMRGDKLIMYFSYRSITSNELFETTFDLSANQVENLNIGYFNSYGRDFTVYSEYNYTHENVSRALSALAHKAKSLIDTNDEKCCKREENCNYYSVKSDKCIHCASKFILLGGKCLEKCPEGTYLKNNECMKCSNKCLACKNEKSCDKCADKTFLNVDLTTTNTDSPSSTCVNECPSNTWPVNSKCTPCTKNCQICKNENTCSQCAGSLILFEGKCVESCNEEYFLDYNPKTCKKCHQGCEKCSDFARCSKCKEGYFLKEGVCVTNCGEKFFGDNFSRQCKSCPDAKCQKCDKKGSCLNCEEGSTLDEKKNCRTKCKVGTVNVNEVCIKCTQNEICDICDANNVNICLQCANNYVIHNGECRKSCPDGFYANLNNKCVACPENCKTCNKDKCLMCNGGHFLLNDSKCVVDCPEGHISSGRTCIKCKNNNCAKCLENNLETCTKCYANKYIKDGDCVQDCNEGFFMRDLKCWKCFEGCARCKNDLKCDKCENGWYTYEGRCRKKVDPGFRVKDPKTNELEKCTVYNCDDCSQNSRICNKCIEPFLLYNNQCYQSCPTGSYRNSERKCLDCDTRCVHCTDLNSCLQCKNPFFLQNGKCKETCDDGYTSIGRVCTACKNPRCKNCSENLNTCIECKIGEYLFNGNCHQSCPNGFYPDGKQCAPCKFPCETCKNEKKCLSCQNNLKYNSETLTCLETCKKGFVMPAGKTLAKDCVRCADEGCIKCLVSDINVCLECHSEIFWKNGVCVEECGEGWYANNGNCLKCPANCKSCPESASKCEECNDNFFLKNGNSCVSDCGEGWIKTASKKCLPCSGNCKKCTEDSLNSCTECYHFQYLHNGRCVDNCPERFWGRKVNAENRLTTNECKSCTVNDCAKCSLASNGEVCERCVTGFYRHENKCVRVCPQGYLNFDVDCVKSNVDNCLDFPPENTNICHKCKSGYVLIAPHLCDNKCPSGKFLDKSNESSPSCKNCINNCQQCNDQKNCLKCNSGFYLQNNLCVRNCDIGYRLSGDKCIPCTATCDTDENCATCSETACLSCKWPFFYHSEDQTCLKKCPDGFWGEQNFPNKECRKCLPFCKKCSDSKICEECQLGKVITQEGKCADSCPDGSVRRSSDNNCVLCSSDKNCRKCKENELDKCELCKDGFLIYNDKQCVEKCPSGFFSRDKRCNKCLDNCASCDDSKSCIQCNANYFLLKNQCVPTCPDSFYVSAGKCVPCKDPNAETCTAEKPITCRKDFLLEEGVCRYRCSEHYYKASFTECKPCSKMCVKCTSFNQCISCTDGWLVKDGKCVEKCGDNFVAVMGKCVNCENGCRQCLSRDPSTCVDCHSPRWLIDGKCQPECGAGFWQNTSSGINKCSPCMENCQKCDNDSSCQMCRPGFFYKDKKCVKQCGEGFYQDVTTRTCVKCHVDNCKNCSNNPKICNSCRSPFYKLENSCVKDCKVEDGFYSEESESSLVCRKCKLPCKTCEDLNTCISCHKSWFLKEKTCVNECPDGEIPLNGSCQKCKTNFCKTCKNNLTQCTRCKPGRYLVPSDKENVFTCETECPEGMLISNGIECINCPKNCAECHDSKTCVKCKPGFIQHQGTCVERCPTFFVERNLNCVRCPDSNCQTCDNTNLTTCRRCIPGMKLHKEKCINTCPVGTYVVKVGDILNCVNCVDNCIECENSSTCKVCKNSWKILNGKCVENCPNGYSNYLNRRCENCSDPECKTCADNDSQKCTQCNTNFALTQRNSCVKDCGAGFWRKSQPFATCVPCNDVNCVQCSSHNNTCDKCQKGWVVYNDRCVSSCPVGHSDVDGVCKPCEDNKCHDCFPHDLKFCKKCRDGFLIHQSKCVNSCPVGTFKNRLNECQKCSLTCANCRDESYCHKCNAPFVLHTQDGESDCRDNCPNGHVEIKGKCSPCLVKDCIKCSATNLNVCLECKAKHFLHDSKCPAVCPDGFFAEGEFCKPCIKNCSKCSSGNKCQICKTGFALQNGECVDKCDSGYILLNNTCQRCDNTRCETCASDKTTCTSCAAPNKLRDGDCFANCDVSQFFDKSTNSCKNCQISCEKCSEQETCEKCIVPKILNQNKKCVDKCDAKYYHDRILNKCVPCANSNCLTCDVNNSKICLTCPPETFKHLNRDCVKKCPPGFQVSAEPELRCAVTPPNRLTECKKGYAKRDNACLKCREDACDICDANNLTRCQKCQANKVLYNFLCLDSCPKSSYKDSNNNCQQCPSNCSECDDEGVCKKCEPDFYFNEDTTQCVRCPHPRVIEGKTCQTCRVPACESCEKQNHKICELCRSDLVLYNNRCEASCPESYFRNGGRCKYCGDSCLDCTSTDNCLKCKSPLILHDGKCVPRCPNYFADVNGKCTRCTGGQCLECSNKNVNECKKCEFPSILHKANCITQCPGGYYKNAANNTCIKCQDGCQVCDKERCIECDRGLKIKDTACVSNCGKNFYDSGKTCIACSDVNCNKCAPQNKCESCNKSTFLLKKTGECKDICPDGYYADSNTNKCQHCSEGCKKCTSKGKCFTCEKGFYLLDGACRRTCPEGYTTLATNCVKCTEKNCLRCEPENPDKCTKCKDSFLYNSRCHNVCPKATFPSGQECKPCAGTCLECTSESKCKKCKPEFALVNGECANSCPDGRVKINGVCVSCADNKCAACSTDVNSCLRCKNPYLLHDSRCLTTCPEGFKEERDKCTPCPVGCKTCNKQGQCLSCKASYFYNDFTCRVNCPKGQFQNCNTRKCENCDEACDDCIDKTNKDCVTCNKNFYRDDKTCVKEKECHTGTYADKNTRKCENCKLPYCKECSDKDTCTLCAKGFTLVKDKCIAGKTFIPVIIGYKIFDKFRPDNKNTFPISELKGVGAGSPHISFNFWFKLLSPLKENTKKPHTNLISFKGPLGSSTYDYTLYINSFDRKCGFKVTDRKDNRVGNVNLDDCDFEKISRWRFYTVTIVKKAQEFKIKIKIRDLHDDKKKYIKFDGKANNDGSTDDIINKDSKIVLNDNDKKLVANFKIFNMNLLDYSPNDDEVEEFYKKKPSDCDYFCSNCDKTCKKCQDGFVPKNGYCKPVKIPVAPGITEVDIDTQKDPINFLITSNVHKAFESDRYAFSTWLYADQNLDDKIIDLYRDFYDGDKQNNEVKIKNGQLVVNGSNPNTSLEDKIKPHTWYFIMVGFSREITNVKVYSGCEGSLVLTKNIKNDTTKAFLPLWNASTFKFDIQKGSLYNVELYLNNIPEEDDLKEAIHALKCPSNCKLPGKSLTCLKCAKGYVKSEDGTCQLDIDVKSPASKVLERIDLNDKETHNFADRDFIEDEEYSVSFWLRKKTHSYIPTEAVDKHHVPKDIKKDSIFNILSAVDTQGKIHPLIELKNKKDFESIFSFFNFGKQNDNSKHDAPKQKPLIEFPHTFDEEIYNFIHVVIVVNKTKNTLTYNVKDFSTNKLHIKTEKLTLNFNKAPHDSFMFGDKKGFEINMEVFWVQLFNVALNEISIEKMRELKPIDCNAGCKTSCDYSTGRCDMCASGLKNTMKCPAYLLGYKVSYLYSKSNPSYDTLLNLSDYVNILSNAGFTNNINSLKYSVIGFFKVFDFENTVNRNDVKYRLVTVGNRKKINFINNASHDVLAIDLNIKDSSSGTLSVIVNMSGEKKNFDLKDLEVTKEKWYAFHAGVDVKNKSLKFKLIDLGNKKEAKASHGLKTYPENLQSSAGISVLGVHDFLNDNTPLDGTQVTYLVPSVRLAHTYLIPNSDYNDELLKKFLDKFQIPKDPKCEDHCDKCLLNQDNKLECISCASGYFYENGRCQEEKTEVLPGVDNKFPYLVLSGKDVITGNKPQKYVLDKIKGLNGANGELPESNTLQFYLRRNYYSNADRKVVCYGKIDLYVTKDASEIDTLELRIKNTNLKTSIKLSSNKYKWYAVLISVNKNKITINAISELKKDEVLSSSLTLPESISGPIAPNSEFSIDSNFSEFQLYGAALALANISKPIISWPKIDCGIDCSFCENNKCKVCLYGFKKEKCVSKNLQFPSENTYVSLPLTKFLKSNQPLRSNKYTLFFTIKINASGMVNLFKFNNDKLANNKANPQDHLTLKYNTQTFKFYIEYTTRHGLVVNKSGEVIEAKYSNRPTLSEHFVAFSVENKKITYFIWNNRENYVRGEFGVEGFMDYITTNTHLHFFGQKPEKADTLPGFVDNIRVYYDEALPLTKLIEKAQASTGHVQPRVCKEGNRLSCKSCADGNLINQLCQPEEHANVLISGQVVPVSRFTPKDTKNFTFQPKIKDSLLKTFTLDFWWRPTALINTPQSLINIKYNGAKPDDKEPLFWILYTPLNALEIGYSSQCNENAKTLTINEVIRPEEMFKWIHVRVNVDLTKRTQVVTIKHDSTKRKILRKENIEDSEVPKTGLKFEPNTKLYLSHGSEEKSLFTNENVSFEVAHLAFIANYLPTNDIARKYQTIAPNMNDIPCLKNAKSEICPHKDRIIKPISIGDHIAGLPNIKKTDDLSYLKKVPLFRPLFANAPYAQSFYYYLLSFQVDVPKYLSSTYAANRDTLLTIHNNNKPEYDALSMDDVIPDSLSRNGAISFGVSKGGIKLFNGYSPSTNSINSFDVPLGGKSINNYNKIYVSLLVDILNKTSRIVVLADELVYSVDITKSELTSPINFYSLVYTHPVLEKVDLTFFNPRLYNDLDKNVEDHLKSIKKDKDAQEKCDFNDSNCRQWFIPEETKAVYCLGCKEGFKFYEGSCKPQFVKKN